MAKSEKAGTENTPGPGEVKTDEGKKFADELAAEDAEAGALSIPRPDGAIILSLTTEEGKRVTEIPAGTKKLVLRSEMKGTESAPLKIIFNGSDETAGELKKIGEIRVNLDKNKTTEKTVINPAGGKFEPGSYRLDVFLKEEKIGELSFKVSPAAK